MSITVYSNVILPESVIAAGIRGRNLRSNTRAMSGSGYVAVNINWARTLRQYELGIKPMSIDAWLEIEALHEVTDGGAEGFLMQDPKDRAATDSNGKLYGFDSTGYLTTIGYGAGTPTYKLHKRYSTISGTRTYDRRVTRPKSAISVKRAGSAVTAGGGAGQVSVNYETGVLTFAADADAAITAITTGGSTTVSFTDGTFPALFASAGRLYITGVTGTAATALNSRSHVISSVSGNQIVVSTSTAGLAATITTARGYKYPQPTQTLTWSGDFYVPVHFANDDIDWELLLGGSDFDSRVVAGPSVLLREVRED